MQTNLMDETLEHHGIKGMKWGVRRTPEQLGYRRARAQVRRNERADRFLARASKDNARINRSMAKSVKKAQSKADAAREKGADASKLAKLDKKVREKQIRAEIVKERNADLAKRTADYTRKSFMKKLSDPQTYNQYANYDKATEAAVNRAKKKYGDETVSSIQRKDNAKVLAVGAAIVAGYAAVGYAAAQGNF